MGLGRWNHTSAEWWETEPLGAWAPLRAGILQL